MLEFLMASILSQSGSGEQEILPPAVAIGQPNVNVINGSCQSIDGSQLYVIGGSVNTGPNTNALFKYDIALNTWTRLGSVLASMNNVIYWSLVQLDSNTLVGMNRTICAFYDLTTNTWTMKTAITGTRAGMYFPKAHLYNGKIYRVGQPGDGNDLVTRYDPVTDTHTDLTGPNFTTGTYSVSALVGSKIYVFPNGSSTVSQNMYSYNIDTNQVVVGIPFTGSTIRTAVAVDNNIYLLGYGDQLITCYKFDTIANTLTKLKDLVRPVYMAMSYYKEHAIYLYGGRSSTSSTVTYYTDTLIYKL